MENNFYRDQFEQLLKDTADSFRMYPSRRVWNSIYNNLHPGRKWPSIAIFLLLIGSVMYIDITNPTHPVKFNAASDKNTTLIASATLTAKAPKNTTTLAILQANRSRLLGTVPNTDQQGSANEETYLMSDDNDMSLTKQQQAASPVINEEKRPTGKVKPSISVNTVFEEKKANKEKVNNLLTQIAEKNKLKDRWEYQIYATPSVGYRIFQKADEMNDIARGYLSNPQSGEDYSINHSSALNLEAGGNLMYNLTSKLRVKAGIQFNYTNYYVNGYELEHPVYNTLRLNSGPVGMSTSISNSQTVANTVYNNNTYQFSVPLGADFRITGNKTLKWYAGATIQPTYVANANALFVSSDMKNYMTDESLVRKFNMNGGLETFVTYTLNSGITLNAGPQVRYQFLSTYSSDLPYKEKLFNFGIKFGVTSRF